MSEAWHEVARLGDTAGGYPHALVDSHGWCLRLGPRKRIDERYYSSVQSLVLGLTEHGLRSRLGALEGWKTVEELQRLVLAYLKEAATLGAKLEQKLGTPAHLRPVPGPGSAPSTPAPPEPLGAPRFAAGAPETGSLAASSRFKMVD